MNFRIGSKMNLKWPFFKNRTIWMLLQKMIIFAQFYFSFSRPLSKLRQNQHSLHSHSHPATFQHVLYGTKDKEKHSCQTPPAATYISPQTSLKTFIKGYGVCSPWLLWWRWCHGCHLTAATSHWQGPPLDVHLLDNSQNWVASWLVGGEPCGLTKALFWLYKGCQGWGMKKTRCKRDQTWISQVDCHFCFLCWCQQRSSGWFWCEWC